VSRYSLHYFSLDQGGDVKRGILLLCVLVLAGCGGDGGGNGGSGDVSGDVSFMVFGDPEEIQAYRDVIAAYENENPDVDVKMIEASDRDDLIARLSTSFAAGTPPDLFLLNYRFYAQYAARGVLEPIEDRVDDSDLFQQEDFYEEAMNAFSFNDTLTCLPQNISSLVVYYNKDLFEKAGVAFPKEGWKWDEMVAAAKKLTTDSNGDGKADVYGLGIESSLIRIAPFVWSAGGELVDDDKDPTHFTLDTPEAQVAMERFLQLHATEKVTPGEEEVEAEDDETRFQNGRLAMVLSSRRSTPTFRTIQKFDWDVAALPQHEQQAGILHSDAYCLTKASENKDAAWSFMEYALGPEGAPIVAESGRTVPSLKSVAESDAFLDPTAKPANSQVFLDTIPVIQQVPSISTWPEIEDASGPILEEAYYDGESAAAVASELRAATDDLFARGEG
jgi:multiple sugar transport system substrate-binding protein